MNSMELYIGDKMKVITTLDGQAITQASAVAMGTFDGVHRAHRVVINKMLSYARACGLASVVFTFTNVPKHTDDHPTEISQLLSTEEKLEILADLGVDIVVILPFDEKLKAISHTAIIDYLVTRLNMRQLFVGYNFKFGNKALGTAEWLSQNAVSYGFNCRIIPEVAGGGLTISSTRIRKLLSDGAVESANNLLGRPHFVSGVVKSGKRIGRTIGFPTANLTIGQHMTNIKSGVYITQTTVAGKTYPSVSNVGFNPTFEQTDFNLETYIMNFDADVYGQTIKVSFLKRIRDELKFDTIDELKRWIKNDVNTALNYFDQLRD